MTKKRNILFITLSDQTGADIALIKLANALYLEGHNVQVLVKDKIGNDPLITPLSASKSFVSELGFVVNREGKMTRLGRDVKYLFNSINEENSYQDIELVLKQLRFNPHLIFVGISYDFLTSTDILHLSQATQSVVYNVAVDMSHFTGGCHFAWDCKGFLEGCHTLPCPAILDHEFGGLASRNFLIKKENAAKGNFRILAGTMSTRQQAMCSPIYGRQQPIFNISGVVDTAVFNPGNKQTAKADVPDFSDERFYILTGTENTQDERKGFSYFVESVNLFWDRLSPQQRNRVEVLLLTRILDDALFRKIKFRKRSLAYIRDDLSLSSLYRAADVYLSCSIEDAGPAMLIEALACGTPVVSFDTGIAPEFIQGDRAGCLVENRNAEALSAAIERVFYMAPEQRLEMGAAGFKQVVERGSLQQAVRTINEMLLFHQDDFERHSRSLSVALCTCNGEQYISEQLDSILCQNLRPDEIIICDDVSTDATLHVVEAYQREFPDIIKVYKNETGARLGVVKNFEKAINLCSEEIIFLCDQDDIWFPHKTEVAVRIFNRFPEVEAINHNLKICKEDKELLNASMWDTMGFSYFLKSDYQDKNYRIHALLFGNMVTGAAFCMKRRPEPVVLLDHIPEVIHDYQLAITFLFKGNLYFHDECLGLYRQHNHQQLGADLRGLTDSIPPIRRYYEFGNPHINLLFIKRRIETLYVFRYLEAMQNTVAEAHIRSYLMEMTCASLKPATWSSYLKRGYRFIRKKRTDHVKARRVETVRRYAHYIPSLIGILFSLLKIYCIIFYCAFINKKVSVSQRLSGLPIAEEGKRG